MTTTTPTLIQVDPATLRVADQVRQDATPDDALIASVQAHGIQQPPIVTADDEGGYVIEIGHRRVGAAIAAGLDVIWVIVRPGDATVDAGTVERQMVENERRKGLTTAELAQGYAQLEAMFGLTPEDIAAQLGEKPDRVRAGIRAAKSTKITDALAETPTLDLEQAARIAEFDDDPEVQDRLVRVATDRPANLASELEHARSDAARRAEVKTLTAQLVDAGVKVITRDEWLRSATCQIIDNYVDGAGEQLTPENHASCEGAAAFVGMYGVVAPTHVCFDPTVHGHFPRHTYVDPARRAELEQERQERADRDAAVLANRTARRQWIHDLLPGKINQLKGVVTYMAAALLANTEMVYNDPRRPSIVLTLLDRDAGSDDTTTLDRLLESGEVAPFRLMLATALAIHEHELEHGRYHAAIVRHYEHLELWGYQRSDLDETALTNHREALVAQAEDDALRDAGENLDGDPREDDDA